jgi:hypothetical protein
MQHDNVQFDIAEVLSTDISYAYSENIAGNGLCIMYVRSITNNTRVKEYTVKPFDLNNIKLPVVGEVILTCKTVNRTQQNHNSTERYSWYYVSTLALQSGINNNKATGISYFTSELNATDTQNIPSGRTFNDQYITSPLQLFEGDSVYQGRNGQSIRFGTTLSTRQDSYYYKQPTWLGETVGDPIIIISTRKNNLPNKEFVVEDINQDNASLYLTSTQKIDLNFSTTKSPKNLETSTPVSNFIGTADRVMLRSKSDRMIIDSSKDILLNTTGAVNIGGDDDLVGIPDGDKLESVLYKILDILTVGYSVNGSISTPILQSTIRQLASDIADIKSTMYKIKKT